MITADGWKKFSINNKQGLRLSTLLNSGLDDAVVIVCHGFSGSKEGGGRAVEMGDALSSLGFSTLLFDFSGCGESEGSRENISLSSQVSDLESVVRWCRSEGFMQLVLTGRSFGGSTALSYAASDKMISAVSTWAAVARPSELFEQYLSEELSGPSDELVMLDAEEGLYLKKGFFYDLRNHNLLGYATALAPRSYLVIHGSADESVPVKDAVLLYEAAGEPKRLEIIEGADHRFSGHTDQVWEVFFRWLNDLS